MTTRRLVTILGSAALVASVWTIVQAQAPIVDRAALVLSMTGNKCGKALVGNDTVVATKDRIHARRGHTVRWTITNNCSSPVTVVLGDWIRKGDKGADRPFDPSTTPDGCTAAAGAQCVINLRIRSDAGATTYSYTTSINGTKHDPDLIIEG